MALDNCEAELDEKVVLAASNMDEVMFQKRLREHLKTHKFERQEVHKEAIHEETEEVRAWSSSSSKCGSPPNYAGGAGIRVRHVVRPLREPAIRGPGPGGQGGQRRARSGGATEVPAQVRLPRARSR